MQKIAEHNIQIYGARGLSISVPRIFASDNGLNKGDRVEIYRDQIDGRDALIIFPKPISPVEKKELPETNG